MPIRATNPLGFKANVIRCATADIHMTPKDTSKHWVDERQGATDYSVGVTPPNAAI